MTERRERLPLTDTCWCGCQRETSRGAFWVQGHDKIAEAALLALDHGDSVAQRLHERDFGPQRSVTDEAVKRGGWTRCDRCGYPGRPESVRLHKARYPNCGQDPWPVGG